MSFIKDIDMVGGFLRAIASRITLSTEFPIGISDPGIAALEKLQGALAGEPIYNVEYKEAADRLSRDFEEASNTIVKGPYRDKFRNLLREIQDSIEENLRKQNPDADEVELHELVIETAMSGVNNALFDDFNKLDVNFNFVGIAKLIREFEAWQRKNPDGIEWLKEYVNIGLAFFRSWQPVLALRKETKGLALKGRKPSGEGKPVYHPPAQSTKSLTMVTDLLKEMIDKQISYLEDTFFEYYDEIAEKVQKIIESGDREKALGIEKMPDTRKLFYVMYDTNRSIRHLDLSTLVPTDITEYMRKESVKDAAAIAEKFIFKNTKKLTSIIGKKTEGEIELIDVDADVKSSGLAFEGHMNFKFSDGTRFNVRNKIIQNYAYGSGFFYQFPTTFHNVYFPDGDVTKMVSEKNMNDIWAKD